MLELAIPLRETIDKSALLDLARWFAECPSNASWYVASDYCFNDHSKKSDVASFSILLQHDTLNNIKSYINYFAPKDLKHTRNISLDFLKYVNSPVIFNFTFVIDRESQLLEDYATKENMEEFFEGFEEFIRAINTSALKPGYIDNVLKRARETRESLKPKSTNIRLSRQIFHVATFASLIFHYLNKVKAPSHITWVSDRDALIDRGSGYIYDLSYFMFLAEHIRVPQDEPSVNGMIQIDKPYFVHQIPAKSGINEYDELIRIPDYLAGTIADLDILNTEFSKNKYYTVFKHSIVNSGNHAIIHISGSGQNLHTKRLVYKT